MDENRKRLLELIEQWIKEEEAREEGTKGEQSGDRIQPFPAGDTNNKSGSTSG